MQPRAGITETCGRVVLACLLVLSQTLVHTARLIAEVPEDKSAQLAIQFQRSLLAIEDGQRDAPRDAWDPQYVVDTVGVDPQQLFNWVQREVTWVPYRGALRGALRGAVGVLMDRVGNSLDQALLLVTLLKEAGQEGRLAHRQLTESEAGDLWQGLSEAFQRQGENLRKASDDPGAPVTVSVPAAFETEQASIARRRNSMVSMVRRQPGSLQARQMKHGRLHLT